MMYFQNFLKVNIVSPEVKVSCLRKPVLSNSLCARRSNICNVFSPIQTSSSIHKDELVIHQDEMFVICEIDTYLPLNISVYKR